MRLVWLVDALRDLERIEAYIANDNPDAATKVSRHLRDAVQHLRQFPDAGRLGNIPGVREIVIVPYPYLIRYRVSLDDVQILRIFHTSQRWELA